MLRLVGAIGLVQLVLGVLGLRKALREGLAGDVPAYPVRPVDEMRSRHWLEGTSLSAPTVMLVVQGVASTSLLLAPRPPVLAARVLGVLGAIMSIGYPIERVWRDSLVAPDRTLTPLTLGGFLLALKMAILGWSAGSGR
ncbi:hypothetical protein ACFQ58_11110 [Agromyces sp. NPDC056523]|uniref:hypothetical protein n=1 Tax=Agromyces sp. NPDC056523 TaxID=3345850 RepID=UPI00366E5F7A